MMNPASSPGESTKWGCVARHPRLSTTARLSKRSSTAHASFEFFTMIRWRNPLEGI
jgi:hypothetical protein